MTKSNRNYEELYSLIDYKFKDEQLLIEAFTHRGCNVGYHYERLEFLGDRVVNLIVAEMLFVRFKKEKEGALAKRHAALVRKEAMSEVALKLGLDTYILLNKYDEVERSNISLQCDICESFFGALYMDAGYEKVKELVVDFWASMIEEYKTPPVDAKSKLQEWAQGKGLPTPVYEVIGSEGVEHAPIFIVKATVTGLEPRIARGGSKREAEQKSAKALLDELGKR